MELAEIRALVADGLAESAECLCTLHLSAMTEEHAEYSATTELLGDAIFARAQYVRAMSHFRMALHGALAESAGGSGYSAHEVCLVIKIAKCHLEMKDPTAAMREVEVVPARQRSVSAHMLLGQLYQEASLRKMAVAAYKAVLQLQPLAVEAVQHLLTLGVDHTELSQWQVGATGASGPTKGFLSSKTMAHPTQSQSLMQRIGVTLAALKGGEHLQFMAHFSQLKKLFPKSVWLQGLLARSLAQAEYIDEALLAFRSMRNTDPSYLDSDGGSIETFGTLLFDRGTTLAARELSSLANDVLAVDSSRPTGWLLAALCCQLHGEHEKARRLVEKAVDIEPLAACFRIKGRILLAEPGGRCADQALISYFQANSLQKDVASFAGLVQAHLALGKIKDATSVAKDCVTLLPRSPASYVLIGQCLARHTNGLPESVKAYAKAMKIHPDHMRAVELMAEALVTQGKLHEASLCLRGVLERQSGSSTRGQYQLRTQFAKVLAALGNFPEAIEELHVAIAQAPAEYADAALELERVEGMLSAAAASQEESEEREGGVGAGEKEEDDDDSDAMMQQERLEDDDGDFEDDYEDAVEP